MTLWHNLTQPNLSGLRGKIINEKISFRIREARRPLHRIRLMGLSSSLKPKYGEATFTRHLHLIRLMGLSSKYKVAKYEVNKENY